MQTPENKWLAVLPQCQVIKRPTIDPRLEELNTVVRSAECLRHFILSVEFWISPSGLLRQWMKQNILLAAFLLIPAVLLMPVISLVLHEVEGWLSTLLSIVWKLILLSIIAFVAVCVVKHRQKHFPSSSSRSSGRRK